METYIIAEAGVNHDGDIKLAKKLIDIAVEAQADAIKFQTFITENEISIFAEKADYQKRNTDHKESQFEMVKKLELSFPDFIELKDYCENKGIDFLSTPFDFESADFLLREMNLETVKIPSGEITNAPFLLHIARYKKKMIISTGMATISEIQTALGVIAYGLLNSDDNDYPTKEKFDEIYISEKGQRALQEYVILLHCTTEYPAPLDTINLNSLKNLEQTFGLPVGYSDHTEGIVVPIAAVSLGACIIEKHITYDKNADGPDHKASIDPEELKNMVKNIRQVEVALGNSLKIPSSIELKNRKVARKSLVAAKHIKKGDVFTEENIAIKRPGTGISPLSYWDILGMRASRDFEFDEEICIK